MSVYTVSTLPNGLRILSAPMGHAQSTACYVMLQAGSRYERRQENGLAHFVEHMLFTGTERRPTVRALTGEVDAMGGRFNASTAKEFTLYYVKCASEHAPQALDVLADMLRNTRFDLPELEREQNIVVEELRGRFDTPKDYVDELYEELLYGDTALGRRILGTEESVRGLTREDCLAYMDRLYNPSRMVVGLAGKVDPPLLEVVEKLFGEMPPGGQEPIELEPPSGDGHVRIYARDADQAHVCLGLRSVPIRHPDRYPVAIIATILGAGMSSRLKEEVTMRRGLAYTISALNQSHTDAGSLWAQGGINVERADEAISVIAAELRKLATEPVGEEELAKARNYTKGRFVFSIETPEGLVRFGLRRAVLEGPVAEPAEALAGLDAVTVEDVQRVARDLVDGGLYLALIGPYDDAARFESLLA